MGMVFDFRTNTLTCAMLGIADGEYLVSDHEVDWKGTKMDAQDIEQTRVPAWLVKEQSAKGNKGD